MLIPMIIDANHKPTGGSTSPGALLQAQRGVADEALAELGAPDATTSSRRVGRVSQPVERSRFDGKCGGNGQEMIQKWMVNYVF